MFVLAQLSGCASFFCPVSPQDDAPQPIGIARLSVEDVVPLSRDDFVVTALTHPTAMAIIRLRTGLEESIASTPSLSPYDLSASVFPADNGWWFSRQGDEGSVSRAFFVISNGAIQETRVNLPRHDQNAWLPLRGSEPRGVFVSVSDDPRTLQIREVKPSGSRLLGAFPWRETGPKRTLVNSRWSAEALSDGRIAVVTSDEAGDEQTIKLRVVGGAAVDAALPCTVPIDHPIDTAVDGAGRLAVVGLSKDGRVVAMMTQLNPLQPGRCRVISAPDEKAASPPYGTPSVVWAGETFVAAWIRDDGTVRACELRHLDPAPLVVNIGGDANLEHPLRQLVHRTADEVVFVWRTRSGEIVQRWMPPNVVAHTVAFELLRRVCTFFDRLSSANIASRDRGECDAPRVSSPTTSERP